MLSHIRSLTWNTPTMFVFLSMFLVPDVKTMFFSLEIKRRDTFEDAKESDCLVLATRHAEYCSLNLDRIKSLVRTHAIVNCRNTLGQGIISAKAFDIVA